LFGGNGLIPNEKYVLVLNLGLRSIRAIIFDNVGKKLTHSWLPVRTFIEDENVEQDPKEWWSLALRVMDEAISSSDIREKIGYITVTSSSSNLVLVDSELRTLGRSIMVSDKRSTKQAEDLKKNILFKELFNSNNILPVSSFLIPKILWIKSNQPHLYAKAKHFLSSDSFLLMKLTGGVIATDLLNAEKAFYHMDKDHYPPEILNVLERDESCFAPVKAVGNNLGKISVEIKSKLDLSQDVEVILTTYDALASFWGSGANQEGEACLVCGTCSSLRVYSGKGLERKTSGLFSQYFENKNAFVVGGSNNLAGGLLEWAKNAFYQDMHSAGDDYIFNLMEQEAGSSTVGARGLIFFPYLIGERTPFFDTDVRGMFFGLGRTHTRKDIIRSIFEAISFLSLDMIKSMESGGVIVDKLRISGGLTRNELICQIKADITGREVLLLDEVETTALGCFKLIATSLDPRLERDNNFNSVSVKKSFLPNRENHIKYLRLYTLFKKLYSDNKENFKYRNALLKTINTERKHEIKNL